MSLFSLYFGSHGRIGRLSYLGAAVLLTATSVAVNAALMAGFRHSEGAGALVVAMVIGLVFIVNTWAAVGLASKRLRDLGIAGVHAFWVVGIGVVAGAALPFMPGLGRVAGVMSAVAAMAFILIPGRKGANAYGPPPGARPTEGEGLEALA